MENYDILKDLVSRMIICNVNQMIDAFGETEGEYKEGIDESFYWNVDYQQAVEDYFSGLDEDEQKEFEEEYGDIFELDEDTLCGICEEFNLEPEYIEPLEFWAIDKWYANDLRSVGEIVCDFLDFTIWARCTSGQSIALDNCIREVAIKRGLITEK